MNAMDALRASVLIACATLALAACVTRAPAPVVDRRPAVAKPVAAPAAALPDTYVVKRGDTLYSIALDNGVDWRELAALNQLTDPTKLSTGQILRLRAPQPAAAPAAEEAGVVVTPITTAPPVVAQPLGADAPASSPPAPLPSGPASVSVPLAAPPVAAGGVKTEPKGVRLPYSEENLALLQRGETARAAPTTKPEAGPPAPKAETPPPAAKPDASPATKPEPESPDDHVEWGWPASGKVLATFDGVSKGVDIAGRVGDPVYASASGRVVYSGEGIPAYGKLVIIQHNSTFLSVYAHNSQIVVKERQNVAKGQKIAEVGSTGANQTKLHFEIRRQGKPVDPMQYLPSRTN